MLACIAAMSRNRVIGLDGKLPWNLPGDMRHFRGRTLGGVVLMGRSTYDSIGRALPGRENWVLTRQLDWTAPDVRIFHTLESALEEACSRERCWVIGGAQIYQQFLPHCQRQLLTHIEADLPGDTFYPDFSSRDWACVDEERGPEGEQYPYRFSTYQRR